MQTSSAGINLIKHFEGCAKRRKDGRYEAYPDPGTGGVPWTIGYGSTGPDIKLGMVWTRQECEDRLIYDLRRFEQVVSKLAPKTTQPQFDAMVSLCFNIGEGAFGKSTLLRLHNAGDHDGAAKQFGRWNRGGGRVLPGLVKRRAAEAALYQKG